MDKLEVVRSDRGDGGWSLHPAGYSDEEYAAGNVPVLTSGTASQDEAGVWSRPNKADYTEALARLPDIDSSFE